MTYRNSGEATWGLSWAFISTGTCRGNKRSAGALMTLGICRGHWAFPSTVKVAVIPVFVPRRAL